MVIHGFLLDSEINIFFPTKINLQTLMKQITIPTTSDSFVLGDIHCEGFPRKKGLEVIVNVADICLHCLVLAKYWFAVFTGDGDWNDV